MLVALNVAEGNAVAPAGSLPTVRITSRGSHPDDATPGPIPTDIEGMKYTVGQKFIVPSESTDPTTGIKTRYEVASVSYSYPTDAVKGYGTFNTDANGNVTFVGDPTGAKNTTVKVDSTFTQDDQDINHAVSLHFVKSFFWGAQAAGLETIKATAYFNVYKNDVLQPQQYTATDSVQIKVMRPQGNIDAALGIPGIGKGSINGTPRFGIDKDSQTRNGVHVRGTPFGIIYQATVTPSSVLGMGTFQTTQIININNSRLFSEDGLTIKEEFTLPDGTFPDVLDTLFAYNARPIAVGKQLIDGDSPGTKLTVPRKGIPISFYREDVFNTYLMYKPSDSGIFVPVGSINWAWSGSVLRTTDKLMPWAGSYTRYPENRLPIYVAATSNADFPTWSNNVTEFVYRKN